MTDTIRVLVAEDHPIFRSGLRAILDSQADTQLIGEATNGAEAIALADELDPDVVIMDLDMPGVDGLEATRRITQAHPGIAVLALTMLDDEASVLAAMSAGARGYLVKGSNGVDTLRALRAVADGDAVFGDAIAGKVLDRLRQGVSPSGSAAFPDLTQREREILQLVARGYTNAAVAERLFLSEKTVRNYVSTIFQKLDVADRVHAVIRAREAGLD